MPSSAKTLTWVCASFRYEAMNRSPTTVHAVERLLRLGDDLLPVLGLRLAGVDGDHPAAGRVAVGLEPEDRAVVVEERVFVVEVVDQLDEGRVGVAQGLVEDAVLVVGPLRHGDDQVRAVVGDAAVELPLLVVGTLVDEDVVLLGRPELVEVELLIVVGPLQVLAGLGLGEAAVVEAAAVLGPRGPGELDPAEQVVAVAARCRRRGPATPASRSPPRPGRRRAASRRG